MTSSLTSLPKNLDGQCELTCGQFHVCRCCCCCCYCVVAVVVVVQTIGHFRVALDVIMKAKLRA